MIWLYSLVLGYRWKRAGKGWLQGWSFRNSGVGTGCWIWEKLILENPEVNSVRLPCSEPSACMSKNHELTWAKDTSEESVWPEANHFAWYHFPDSSPSPPPGVEGREESEVVQGLPTKPYSCQALGRPCSHRLWILLLHHHSYPLPGNQVRICQRARPLSTPPQPDC